jgi:hypothetical protein
MDYESKYLKYKQKYLNLVGGGYDDFAKEINSATKKSDATSGLDVADDIAINGSMNPSTPIASLNNLIKMVGFASTLSATVPADVGKINSNIDDLADKLIAIRNAVIANKGSKIDSSLVDGEIAKIEQKTQLLKS